MGRAPYSGVPDVQQQGPVGAFEHPQASPQDFGSGVGQAEQGLGQSVQKFSDVLGENAIRMEELNQTRNASIATSAYSKSLGEEYARFDAMKGQAQADYYPTFIKNIEDLRTQAGSGLKSPYAISQYDAQTRYMSNQYVRIGAKMAGDGQRLSWVNADEDAMSSKATFGINMQNNPEAVIASANGIADHARHAATILGKDPNTAALTATGAFYHRLFESMNANGNTAGAQSLYQNVKKYMDENSIAEVDRLMEPANDRMMGDAAAQGAYGRVMGVGHAGVPFTPQALPTGVSLNEDAMVRTIAGEAGGESLTGQRAVAAVIMNRAHSSGASPRDVVFAPNQFEPWNGGAARQRLEAMDPASPKYQEILNNVVRPVVSGEAADPTGGATHFYAPGAQAQLGRGAPSWASGTPTVIGNHNFYKVGYGPGSAPHAAIGAPSDGDLPSSNNARQPLTGDQILDALDGPEINDPRLTEKGRTYAHARLEQRLSAYNQALRADAEHAVNGIVSKALQDPYSVKLSDIATNPALTGPEKATLARELVSWQSGKSQGDGDGFGDVVDRIQAPLGDANRLNSARDLVPLFGHGLTYAGFEKAQRFMKDRDAPDGPALKAAMDTWKSQILGGAIGDPKFATPASRQRWVDFLAAVQPQIEQARGKLPMADIVGAGGPVQKMIDTGHYVLSAEEMFQSMVPGGPAGGATAAPVAPVVGHWYVPVGNFSGQFREVQPGTPGARRLTAPSFAPESFASAQQALPTAPTDER